MDSRNCGKIFSNQPEPKSSQSPSSPPDEKNSNLRAITYFSKLKLLIRANKVLNKLPNLLKFTSKLSELSKATSKVSKLSKLQRVKKLLSASHEITHSVHHVASERLFKMLNIVATAYIIFDALNKCYFYRSLGSPTYSNTFILFGDTIFWHFLASNYLPGLIINLVLISSHRLLHFYGVNSKYSNYISCGLALGCIPFIIHPIDKFTDFIMDETIRKYYNDEKGKMKKAIHKHI